MRRSLQNGCGRELCALPSFASFHHSQRRATADGAQKGFFLWPVLHAASSLAKKSLVCDAIARPQFIKG